ncbi:MAG: signal peptidase I [Oscillospiraceae bacterium]|nr:signal peptidase I [Oscillospiraceae bacterium]
MSENAKKSSEGSRLGIYDWLQCVVTAVVFGILIFVFIGRTIDVDGRSMLQTLHDEDKLIMWSLLYKPSNGDIVIIKTDSYGDKPLVKRVIAVGGQTVDIDFDAGEVRVDGAVLEEGYINEPTRKQLDFKGPVTVPEGHIFVLGDNRNESSDSRSDTVGFVDVRNVLGKVLYIAIPSKNEFGLRDWSRVGSVYGTG